MEVTTAITTQDVLDFLSHAGAGDWHLVSSYILQETKLRDVEDAALLRVGDSVSFLWPPTEPGSPRFTGIITQINPKKGRLHLLADLADDRFTGCVLPATMAMKM